MADDQKNLSITDHNSKQKIFQQTQLMTNKKNVGSNVFTSRNKGKKVLHIGVKH